MRSKHRLVFLCAAVALASGVPAALAQQPNPFAAIQSQLQTLLQKIDAVDQKIGMVSQKIDELPAPGGLVPFSVQAEGGLCDSGPSPSSNPAINIEGTGSNLFVITSILVKTAPQPSGQEGYTFLTVNTVRIDGASYDTRTGNIVGSADGFGVQESADLMGTPVRIDSPVPLSSVPRMASPAGGSFPHQIVADSNGAGDVRVTLFCRSDTHPLSVESVRVSGWKSPDDTIAVTYTPGT